MTTPTPIEAMKIARDNLVEEALASEQLGRAERAEAFHDAVGMLHAAAFTAMIRNAIERDGE